jgi:hypothetical protein
VTEPLLAVCLLGSFWSHLRSLEGGADSGRWRAFSLLAYALALLSKETAVVLPLLLIAHSWTCGPAGARPLVRARAALRVVWPYLLLTALHAAARHVALGGLGHARRPIPLKTMALTWPLLLFTYLKRLLWPVGLSAFDDTPYVWRPGLTNLVLPALVVVAVALVLARLARRAPPVVALAALWMVIPILPVLNTSVFFRELRHDRYLYLPSIGFAILVAAFLQRVPAGLVAVVACLLASLTIRETIPWATDLRLYRRGVEVAPGSALARHGLAVEMDKLGLEGALSAFREELRLDPDSNARSEMEQTEVELRAKSKRG